MENIQTRDEMQPSDFKQTDLEKEQNEHGRRNRGETVLLRSKHQPKRGERNRDKAKKNKNKESETRSHPTCSDQRKMRDVEQRERKGPG